MFPHVPAASVVLKLRNREANDIFFREMGELCAAIQVSKRTPAGVGMCRMHCLGYAGELCTAHLLCAGSQAGRQAVLWAWRWRAWAACMAAGMHGCCPAARLSHPPPTCNPSVPTKPQDLLTRTSPQLPQLADSLLEVACQETGVKLGRERVLTGCRTALAAIHEGEPPVCFCALICVLYCVGWRQSRQHMSQHGSTARQGTGHAGSALCLQHTLRAACAPLLLLLLAAACCCRRRCCCVRCLPSPIHRPAELQWWTMTHS